MGKWPRLIVAGERITPEQADEVLVRTHLPFVSCGDAEWQWLVEGALGVPHQRDKDEAWLESTKTGVKFNILAWHQAELDVWEELGWLSLSYLHNSRVEGDPRGWCDWDGTVGCSTYTIGKWPTVEELTEEWRVIAEAFPFLRLQCQVRAEAQFGPDGEVVGVPPVVAEWHVGDGLVRQVEIGPALRETPAPEFDVFAPGAERGVGLERLVGAVARVRGR
jgi:hypothetical protein